MSLVLEDDRMCYVCGEKNPKGLKLKFEHPKPGLLKAVVVFQKEHQGYNGVVHGGMMAMVLDEMMVNLAWTEGIPTVTGELITRFKKPAKIGQKIHFEGVLDASKRKGRVVYASASAKTESGVLLASATATCIQITLHENIDQKKDRR